LDWANGIVSEYLFFGGLELTIKRF
jgi:hypothetical protein